MDQQFFKSEWLGKEEKKFLAGRKKKEKKDRMTQSLHQQDIPTVLDFFAASGSLSTFNLSSLVWREESQVMDLLSSPSFKIYIMYLHGMYSRQMMKIYFPVWRNKRRQRNFSSLLSHVFLFSLETKMLESFLCAWSFALTRLFASSSCLSSCFSWKNPFEFCAIEKTSSKTVQSAKKQSVLINKRLFRVKEGYTDKMILCLTCVFFAPYFSFFNFSRSIFLNSRFRWGFCSFPVISLEKCIESFFENEKD